jgi:hypothetical protein
MTGTASRAASGHRNSFVELKPAIGLIHHEAIPEKRAGDARLEHYAIKIFSFIFSNSHQCFRQDFLILRLHA